jgi:hypothetical protein
MDQPNVDELRRELAALEAAETKISAERRRLHDKIDYGFADAATLAREREVSDERRRVHQRIDSLRELLSDEKPAVPDAPRSPLSQWSGVSPELVAIDDASAQEPEL